MLVCVTTQKGLEKSFSDQTERFPARSSRGDQYIFILYSYDANSINARPIKSRESIKVVDTCIESFNLSKSNGHEPKIHILDNECSFLMKETFKKHDVKYQLVPPYVHRRNVAERAI